MGRSLLSKIQSGEQFKTLLQTLSLDLGKANDCIWLFRTLVEARNECSLAMRPLTFWPTFFGALHYAGLHGPARVYDEK